MGGGGFFIIPQQIYDVSTLGLDPPSSIGDSGAVACAAGAYTTLIDPLAHYPRGFMFTVQVLGAVTKIELARGAAAAEINFYVQDVFSAVLDFYQIYIPMALTTNLRISCRPTGANLVAQINGLLSPGSPT